MRWRDVKQGKTEPKKEKGKNTPSLIPPIASIPERIKAFITDSFMLLMPLMYFVFYVIMGSREAFAENMAAGWAYIFIPHFLIVMLFWKIKGQTPGYKNYNIIVVSSDGSAPSFVQLFFRYILFALSIPLIAGLCIGFIRKDKKNLHDIFSGTMPAVKQA